MVILTGGSFGCAPGVLDLLFCMRRLRLGTTFVGTIWARAPCGPDVSTNGRLLKSCRQRLNKGFRLSLENNASRRSAKTHSFANRRSAAAKLEDADQELGGLSKPPHLGAYQEPRGRPCETTPARTTRTVAALAGPAASSGQTCPGLQRTTPQSQQPKDSPPPQLLMSHFFVCLGAVCAYVYLCPYLLLYY
jgi:hypothetical protein